MSSSAILALPYLLWHTEIMANLDLVSIFLIAIGLSIDCFAVAVSGSVSLRNPSPIQIFRTALAFGIFQALMPVIGWLAGQTVVDLVAGFDHWVAFTLLAAIGSKMIWNAFHRNESQHSNLDISSGLPLLVLSVATSIDALAVGLSFAFLETNIALASVIIGVVAFIATITGFHLGRKTGRIAGDRAEIIGGFVLIAIGLRILMSHIL